MALTVEQALAHASHAIGGSGEQSGMGGLTVLNYAGQYLCGSRSWRWLDQQQVTLDIVNGQDYVWLPRGLQSIVGLDMTQGLTTGITLTTHQNLVELRTSAITTSTWRYWAALTHAVHAEAATATVTFTTPSGVADAETLIIDDGFNPAVTFTFKTTVGTSTETDRHVLINTSSATTAAQALSDAINSAPTLLIEAGDATTAGVITLTHRRKGVSGNNDWSMTDGTGGAITLGTPAGGIDPGPARPRLDIYPAPTANDEDAVTLYFKGGWTTLDEDTILMAIPEWFEPVYIAAVRQVSAGFEMEGDSPMADRLTDIFHGPEYAAAVQVDDNMTPDYGRIRGGAAQTQLGIRASNIWNFNEVSAPS